MEKMAILLAEGFEDTELIGAIDFWTREEIEFELISIHNKKQLKGSYYAMVDTTPINEVSFDNFDHLFIPGGQSTIHFKEYENSTKIILDFYNKGKGVFAICAAPSLLCQAGVLKNKKFTSWPGLKLKESTGSPVEIDNNVITGRDYLATMEFAKEVSIYIKKK